MALNDLLANPGNPFLSSFMQAESARRVRDESSLRMQMNQQSLAMNEMKLESQQKQAGREEQAQKLLSGYTGDKRELADNLIRLGDPQKAASIIQIESTLQGMDQRKRKEAEAQIKQANIASIQSSDAILQAFKSDETGRAGMMSAIQEREKLLREAPSDEAREMMEQAIPDFQGMHPADVQKWVEVERSKSLAIRQFDDLQEHRRAMEAVNAERAKAAKVRAEKAAKKGFKKTKSDRQMELASLIANDKATPEEVKEFDLLNRTDPLDIAIRDALKRSTADEGGKVAKPTTDDEYNALPSGSSYIDPDDGKQYKKP